MARMTLRTYLGTAVAGSIAAAVLLTPVAARADGVSSPTGKGIVGGALLGAEGVVTIEAIAGVQAPWAYAVGAIVGAGGGGVGGHFAENGSDAKVPLYLLAGGMALAIPATILALNATSYKPPRDYQEDKAPPGTEAPADAPTAPRAPATPTGLWFRAPAYVPAPTVQMTLKRPEMATSLLNWRDGMRLGVPAVEVRPLYSMTELRQLGVEQKEEIRVPVFNATW